MDPVSRRALPLFLSALPSGLALALALLLTACSGSGAGDHPDVLLITVDSLRAGAPGFMGGRAETPAMDALAASGCVFTQAISPVPQTLPSLAGLHTGLYPLATGVHDDGLDRLEDGKETLAGLFKKAGYSTAAFPAALALHPKHGLDRGFDTYQESFAEIPRPRSSPAIGIPAPRIVDRAIEWLGALPQGTRFFLWVNLFDPHFFYEPPSPFKEKYADRPYDGEVAFTDHELSRLVKWIADHGRDPTTLIVLAGNHGEALGESGEEYHGVLLRETTLRVPLVIRPGSASKEAASRETSPFERVKDPVSLVDVAPTIADLAGLEKPPMQGTSLAGYLGRGERPDPSRAIYFETMLPRTLFGWAPLRGVRAGGLKYVEAPGTAHTEIYDLAADPDESRDIAASRSGDAARLAAETARLGGPRPSAPVLSPGDADIVRSLQFPTEGPKSEPILPAAMVSAGNAALKAHRSFQRGMLQAAAFLFSDILRQDPGNDLALIDFGSMYLGIRNAAKSDELFRKAQSLYPAGGEVYHQLGHLTIGTARSAADAVRARQLFELAVRLDPLNEEALYDAACAVAPSDPDRALDYLDRSVKNGFRDFPHMARDTDLDPIRKNPRFDKVTEGQALPPAPSSPSSPTPAGAAAAAPKAASPPR